MNICCRETALFIRCLIWQWLFPCITLSHESIIHTDKGRVLGLSRYSNGKKVDVFWGIPFAKPPVGRLRFMYPEHVDPWQGVYNATQRPNTCVQGKDEVFRKFSGATQWNPNTNVSEDCLYLNVWVPQSNPPVENKAVMVWIYGGGFYSGTTSLDLYDASLLAGENDVIVVSINYRVGALGFLSLNTVEARGNAGMMDQRMGLEWVQRNIRNFGGSPKNVTIFGESAGAVSVGLHLLSSLSRGLFRRAILQSGAPQVNWGTYSLQEGRRRSRHLAELLNCNEKKDENDNDIVNCLRKVNPELFYRSEFGVVDGIVQFPFVPVIDGFFLHDTPSEYLRTERFKKTQLLLGSNSNEGTWFLVYENGKLFRIDTESLISENNMKLAIDSLFFYHPQYPVKLNRFGKDAILFRYTDWKRPSDMAMFRDNVGYAVGDYHIVCEVNQLADVYAKSGQRIYQYWFDHRYSTNPWPLWMGTLHGDEISLVFGLPLDSKLGYSDEDKQLSKRIMRYWTNFAKTG